ncbi:MAG TPA: DUF4445 domain-containing protein [Chloroflexi bacterium]|nr:DUF4445 domain-containing protein [Chloroflexota bacterium]
MNKKTHRVIFQPMGVRVDVEEGLTLRAAARQAGVAIDSICGERATCGKCKVIVQRGEFAKERLSSRDEHLSPPDEAERAYWEKRSRGILARGEDPDAYRLSCQARVQGDVVVMVPESSRAVQQVVRKAATERVIEVRPIARKLYVELEEATLENPRGDWERLKAALAASDPLTRGPRDLPLDVDAMVIDLPALRALQRAVREGQWRLTVTVRAGREVIRVEPGFSEHLLGLAVDIGTTTIVAHLCDLQNGDLLATEDMMNPQVGYGEDIMSRMSFAAEQPDGLETLHSAVIRGLNQLARRVARRAGVKASEIVELVVVGNTVMHHFFLGLDTKALGQAPYVPALHDAVDVRARDVGLSAVNEGAYIHLLPITASFVGADNMAVLLAEAPHEQDEHLLIVDVGTNAELVLGNRERLVCTSTPTGPAFEGAHVEYGMRAAEGAIERVEIDPETLVPRFKVIGADRWSEAGDPEAPRARGICGSGIIDAVSELYRVGLLRPDGRFSEEVASPNLRRGESGPFYVLAEAEQTTLGRPIPITQDDVRQIQLAKAPLYVAARYLLRAFGLERPDRILLAGGFGSHIDPVKAMLIGMIPDCPLDRVYAVGNSAGDGARIALLNRDKRREAVELLNRIERIELPAQPGFQDQFMLALHLPHMVDPYPNLEGVAPPRTVASVVERLFGDEVPRIEDSGAPDPVRKD